MEVSAPAPSEDPVVTLHEIGEGVPGRGTERFHPVIVKDERLDLHGRILEPQGSTVRRMRVRRLEQHGLERRYFWWSIGDSNP